MGKQQMVEIAKAVSHRLRILILDEPTAALTDAEIDELFAIMRDLASKGTGLIHISHRLDEIHRIADRVTVLRDGELVDTKPTSEVTKQQIINMMVGRVIYEQPKTKQHRPRGGARRPRVNKLNAGKLVRDISFELRQGEILGMAGLMGSGGPRRRARSSARTKSRAARSRFAGAGSSSVPRKTPSRTASATSPRTASASAWRSTSA